MSVDWPRIFSRVKAALLRRGRSEQDADDLVHEAWLRLARFEREHQVVHPEAFLMKAALNLAVDAHRASEVRGHQVMLEDVVLLDTKPSVEDVLLGRERIERLSECLAQLSDKTRDIFLAHRVDGLTYEEISRRHGMAISSVHKHIAKALLIITSSMEGWYP